jgi:hypothetical protein
MEKIHESPVEAASPCQFGSHLTGVSPRSFLQRLGSLPEGKIPICQLIETWSDTGPGIPRERPSRIARRGRDLHRRAAAGREGPGSRGRGVRPEAPGAPAGARPRHRGRAGGRRGAAGSPGRARAERDRGRRGRSGLGAPEPAARPLRRGDAGRQDAGSVGAGPLAEAGEPRGPGGRPGGLCHRGHRGPRHAPPPGGDRPARRDQALQPRESARPHPQRLAVHPEGARTRFRLSRRSVPPSRRSRSRTPGRPSGAPRSCS